MRTHPIGTGPFKFGEFRPNEVVRTVRNRDYWKPGRPYLDGIDWEIMKDNTTRNLVFIAGKSDIASPYGMTVPLLNDVKAQAPQAICELTSTNVSRNLILNPEKLPFDNPEMRRAVALTLDRKAFIDIITQSKGDIGATLLPPPEGLWGMPPEMLATLPGYDPDIGKNRARPQDHEKARLWARQEVHGHRPRAFAYRDPAVP
jgi:peptide/nickel transport system substrate-binding protein